MGRAWVGIIPNGEVIGLSKFNRIVHHIVERPQIQEEMTTQIAQGSKSVRQTEKVKNDGNKVRQILTNISPDETPQSVFKKMSNAMILLSQMITNTADVSKSSTLSSVANSVLTKDLTKTLQKIRR